MALAGRLAFVTGTFCLNIKATLLMPPCLKYKGKHEFLGAGSGIGRATCQVLAREGALIVGADRNVDSVTKTIKSISNDSQQKHFGIDLDVAEYVSIKNALDRILAEYAKPPTVIVNSAGITRDNFLLKLSEQDFDEVINVNLKGTFLVMQIFTNAILEYGLNNASIINIASISGKYGNIGQANYAASKAGVELLTKTASKELATKGIRVNAVVPGMISTPITETIPDKVKEKFISMIPLKRFGKPEEIAEVIAFLASDKSSYITGASIDITGGF